MSIYDTQKVELPQVKISIYQKTILYGFLKIFHRKYADFIRDVCDIIVKWQIKENRPSFNEHLDVAVQEITREYSMRDYKFYKKYSENKCIPMPLEIHNFPTKRIVRLPKVTVSKWQAENLYRFLAAFARSYADFVRKLCENISLNIIEAQADMVEFSKSNEDIFKKVFNKIIKMDKLLPGERNKYNQWHSHRHNPYFHTNDK